MGLDLAALDGAGLTGDLPSRPTPAPSASAPGAPAPAPALTQSVTVTMDDGTTFDATLDARDRRAYVLNAARYGLPPFTMNPADPAPDLLLLELLTVFSAWWATRHRLELHRMDWPAFSAHAVDITVRAANEDPVPHPPVRGAG